ncbi:unnamed protein product [Mytilus edulis]|uniref:Uncharacterized protein n=1 Tax=Mytilus edulis TaxID=6550 RepID=A0A8S3UC52_MYTED|nr:unnamed protein product [Mytilus edulis]
MMHKRTCTRKDLKQLLGHLNFASRVILPGRAFVTYLYKLMSTVKESYHYVHLNKEYKADLQMWLEFLTNWNGIHLFYDNQLTTASSISLYTDASSTIGFGVFFKNKWFYDKWPEELPNKQIPGTSTRSRDGSNTLSATVRVFLDCTIDSLWKYSLSNNTTSVYKTGIELYTRFLLLDGLTWDKDSLPPVSETLLMRFVAYCAEHKQLCHSTIKLYLCGIRFHFLKYGGFNPLISFGKPLECLKTILIGLKKKQGSTVKRKRLPITMSILSKMCKLLHTCIFGNFNSIMLEAACTTAFFGFLRCGEFTVMNQFDPECNLCCSDLQITADCIFVTLKKSKTDPFRQGITIPLYKTGKVFISHVKLGLSCDSYNGHSFRIGAAISAQEARLEDHLIQTLGRWLSNCYTRYIHTSPNVLKKAQKQLAETDRS